jgi:chorismate-pyruvate lyase
MASASSHATSPVRRSPLHGGILFPLDVAFARAGLEPPWARAIDAASIPAPYRDLLTHGTDMTGTLERHHGHRVVTRPLSAAVRGRWYARHVLLSCADTGRPLAMGAIRVRLDVFGARVQSLIRQSETPLGRVLAQSNLDFQSRPKVFFELTPNAAMLGVFWMPAPVSLYGRQTELLLDGEKIGDVVEVLPLV